MVVYITRLCNWGHLDRSSWWRLTLEVICFGCRVIAVAVLLLRVPLMSLYEIYSLLCIFAFCLILSIKDCIFDGKIVFLFDFNYGESKAHVLIVTYIMLVNTLNATRNGGNR